MTRDQPSGWWLRSRSRWRGCALLGSGLFVVGACSTLADGGGGDQNLPTAALGPFRPLQSGELAGTRPTPLTISDDTFGYRDVAVLDHDGDPRTVAASAYAAGVPAPEEEEGDPDPSAPPAAIYRIDAPDGRSFARQGEPVLLPDQPWEGDTVGAPSAVRVAGEVWLFYEGADGIGLATASGPEGPFSKLSSAVLTAAEGGWDAGQVPRAPGAAVADDGSIALFYEVLDVDGVARVGEARVELDGTAERRDAPALEPTSMGLGTVGVGDPQPVFAADAVGRAVLHVYVRLDGEDDTQRIGLASRFDDGATLEPAVGFVYEGEGDVSSPWVNRFDGYALLFATESDGGPAVSVGLAPADASLPAPFEP